MKNSLKNLIGKPNFQMGTMACIQEDLPLCFVRELKSGRKGHMKTISCKVKPISGKVKPQSGEYFQNKGPRKGCYSCGAVQGGV